MELKLLKAIFETGGFKFEIMIFLRTISMHVANELNFESCYILYHNLMPIIIGKIRAVTSYE